MGGGYQRRAAAGLGLVLAACSDPHSSVSGTVELDLDVPTEGYSTLEIRAVELDPQEPDARTRPTGLSPFAESVELEGLEFPYAFDLVEDAFYEWSTGWAVAWLSQRGALEPDEWVLASEPFGAVRIELVAPGTHLAPVASDARVVLRAPK